MPSQFTNPANPAAHEATTGPEIWSDTDGGVDVFVAGVGTGGTLTGVGPLPEGGASRPCAWWPWSPRRHPSFRGGPPASTASRASEPGSSPDTLDSSVYDEVLTGADEDALAASRASARKLGLLVGISSGAALHAAHVLAQRPENAGKTIVALLPDTGERYLSTALFAWGTRQGGAVALTCTRPLQYLALRVGALGRRGLPCRMRAGAAGGLPAYTSLVFSDRF